MAVVVGYDADKDVGVDGDHLWRSAFSRDGFVHLPDRLARACVIHAADQIFQSKPRALLLRSEEDSVASIFDYEFRARFPPMGFEQRFRNDDLTLGRQFRSLFSHDRNPWRL